MNGAKHVPGTSWSVLLSLSCQKKHNICMVSGNGSKMFFEKLGF